MRVAIVDDLRTDAELLQGMLRTRLPAGCFVDVYESGRAFLTSEVKHDLVFMDVVMDGMNGIEAAHALREWDMACLLVFLTTSREYAWDAFPVHPFD